jgi:hypothetical protein
MQFTAYQREGHRDLAVEHDDGIDGRLKDEAECPADLEGPIAEGLDFAPLGQTPVPGSAVNISLPVCHHQYLAGGIVCKDLNCGRHSDEEGWVLASYSTVSTRFAWSASNRSRHGRVPSLQANQRGKPPPAGRYGNRRAPSPRCSGPTIELTRLRTSS